MKKISLIGQQFNRLTVIADAENDNNGITRSLVRCICGVEKLVRNASLKSGSTKSCGCLLKDVNPSNGKHMSDVRWNRAGKKPPKPKSPNLRGRPKLTFTAEQWTRLKLLRIEGKSLRKMASTLVAEGLADHMNYVSIFNYLPEIDHQLQDEGWVKVQSIKGTNLYVTFEKDTAE